MLKVNLKLNTNLDQAGLKVVKLLHANNFQAFWVGGVVRNMLLKRPSDNIDVATDATPEQIEKILDKAKIKNKPVGRQFGSILAILDGFKIEITTFRAEGRYSDKRHPDQVEFIHDYLQDAKRRDFTVNALYFDPVKKILYDPTGGIKDLGLRLLKFVGDPKKRIDEDALRMLRGVRLATQLGFKLEKNSFAAIKTRAKYIQGISGERVKAELDKILLAKNRASGIRLLDEIGLLKFIIPEFEPMKRFSHKSRHYHLEGSQFEHTLLALQQPKIENLDLFYALLFHDIGKPRVPKRIFKVDEWVISTRGHAEASADVFGQFAKRLRFPAAQTATIDWLIRNHMWMTKFTDFSDAEQYRLAVHPAFELLIEHWRCDELACVRLEPNDSHSQRYRKSDRLAKQWLKRLSKTKILVESLARGNLIMRYSKFRPGRELGRKIQEAKIQIVLGKIKTETDLKKFLDR